MTGGEIDERDQEPPDKITLIVVAAFIAMALALRILYGFDIYNVDWFWNPLLEATLTAVVVTVAGAVGYIIERSLRGY